MVLKQTRLFLGTNSGDRQVNVWEVNYKGGYKVDKHDHADSNESLWWGLHIINEEDTKLRKESVKSGENADDVTYQALLREFGKLALENERLKSENHALREQHHVYNLILKSKILEALKYGQADR